MFVFRQNLDPFDLYVQLKYCHFLDSYILLLLPVFFAQEIFMAITPGISLTSRLLKSKYSRQKELTCTQN